MALVVEMRSEHEQPALDADAGQMARSHHFLLIIGRIADRRGRGIARADLEGELVCADGD